MWMNNDTHLSGNLGRQRVEGLAWRDGVSTLALAVTLPSSLDPNCLWPGFHMFSHPSEVFRKSPIHHSPFSHRLNFT